MWDRCMEPGGEGEQEEDSAPLCLSHPGLLATPGSCQGRAKTWGQGSGRAGRGGMDGVRLSFPLSSPALAGEASWAEVPKLHFHFLSSPAIALPHPSPKGTTFPGWPGPSRASPSKKSPPCPRGRVEEGASSYSRGGEGTAQPSTAASGPPGAVFTMLLVGSLWEEPSLASSHPALATRRATLPP